MLQYANQQRRTTIFTSLPGLSQTKGHSIAEQILAKVHRINRVKRDDSIFDNASQRHRSRLDKCVLSEKATSRFISDIEKITEKAIAEKSEADSSGFHVKDLDIVQRALECLMVDNDFFRASPAVEVYVQHQGTTEMSCRPNVSLVLRFPSLNRLGTKEDLHFIMQEIKTVRASSRMWLNNDHEVKWPEILGSSNDEELVAVQMVTQMGICKFPLVFCVYFDLHRLIFGKKVGQTLFWAQCKEEFDFIDYVIWSLEALETTKDKFDLYKKYASKTPDVPASMPPTSNVAVNMALIPSIPFFPAVPIAKPASPKSTSMMKLRQLAFSIPGSLLIEAGDFAPCKFTVRQHLLLFQLFQFKIPLPVIALLERSKLVALNVGAGVVGKLTTEPNAGHEAEMLKLANHILPDHTPQLLVSITENGINLLLMTYIGESLYEFSQLTLKNIKTLIQLIEHMHAACLHHHDIRPPNITVDTNGNVGIIDFGLAEVVAGECSGCSDKLALEELREELRKIEEEECSSETELDKVAGALDPKQIE